MIADDRGRKEARTPMADHPCRLCAGCFPQHSPVYVDQGEYDQDVEESAADEGFEAGWRESVRLLTFLLVALSRASSTFEHMAMDMESIAVESEVGTGTAPSEYVAGQYTRF